MKHLPRFFFLVWMVGFASVSLAVSVKPVPKNFECRDFLGTLQLKTPPILFVGCRWDRNRQGKPLIASYRVSGIHAAAAESHLARTVHLLPLRKSCCQWDGPSTQFTGKDGRTYTIYMLSAETSVESRKQWRDIPSFEIVVETSTEEI